MRYYPYGEVRSGAQPTDRRFTGQRYEAGTGLYDYNARTYDPVLGRFIQADTLVPGSSPQSLNRYSYCTNSPLVYVDPSGHITILAQAAIGAGVGAIASIGFQIGRYLSSDQSASFGDAWASVRWDQVAGAAVGGAVAGATFGLVAPSVMGAVLPGLAVPATAGPAVHATGLAIFVGAGGLAGIAGGQASALTEGVVGEATASAGTGSSWQATGALNRAMDAGLGNPATMMGDALVGGIAGGIGHELSVLRQYAGFTTGPTSYRMSWAELSFSGQATRDAMRQSVTSSQVLRSIWLMEVGEELFGNTAEEMLYDPIHRGLVK